MQAIKRPAVSQKLRPFLTLATMAVAFQIGAASATTVTATGVNVFLDSLGVNTHFLNNQYGGSYANVGLSENELTYIGFRYARDNIYGHYPTAILNQVNKTIGTKFLLWMRGDDYTSEMADIAANPQMMTGVEGPNEADKFTATFGLLTGYPAAVAVQKQMFSDVKANAALANIPVSSLTLAYTASEPLVGNLSGYSDLEAFHLYPQWGGGLGSYPMMVMKYAASVYAPIAPGRPSTITEGGWYTQPATGGVTENVQAKYTLDFVFDAFALGIPRTYLYELADEYADAGGAELEYHFGLFHNNGTPKIAATALHNLTSLLANGGIDPKPASLSYNLQGMPSMGYQQLLQKSDNTFMLVLWNDTKIWDNVAYQEVATAGTWTQLQLGSPVYQVDVYDPMVGMWATDTHQNIQSLYVLVPDHPILVKITTTPQVTTVLTSLPGAQSVARGSVANFTFSFQGVAASKAENVFVHFVDTNGVTVWQGDYTPSVPTMKWSGAVSDLRSIMVPKTVAPGTYKIVIGTCDQTPPWQSQPLATGPGVTLFAPNQYLVGSVTVY